MNQPSPELANFALDALEHATNSVVPDGGPLIPFALLDGGTGRALRRFVSDRLEDGVEQARLFVREAPGTTIVAVAWDGYLTVDGRRTDAVFVEASETGRDSSAIFAQRYASAGLFRKRTKAVGNPALVGVGDSLQ